jgi:Flp pilus assembly CpaF family ATPase
MVGQSPNHGFMGQFQSAVRQIEKWLHDDSVTEIMVNPSGEVWIDQLGKDMENTGVKMAPNTAATIVSLVASWTKTTVSADNPIVSAELPDGSRFEGLIPPVVATPSFSIRRHTSMVLTLDDYVNKGTITPEQKALFEKAVLDRENILVVGGTGCHAAGTKIIMADSSRKKVENIIVGDQVMGPDLQPRTVIRLHRGESRMVQIRPDRGEPFVVNEEHLLSLYTPEDLIVNLFNEKPVVGYCLEPISVKDYEKMPYKDKRRQRLWKTGFEGVNRISLLTFSVKEAGVDQYYGFELDGDHLYLTDDYIVHHNSGKTTFSNALVHSISVLTPDHRVITIEDTRELKISSPNAVNLRTSDTIDMTRLLKSCMRLRPDRILVGEVRGPEALALLKAWNTGHPGGVATVHANSALSGLTRLEQLVQEAGIPDHAARPIIAEAVNIVVFIEKTKTGRKISEIRKMICYNGNNYETAIV